MEIGIIGLPSVGKTTIFNLLTGAGVESGYGAKGTANVGIGKVPDARIDKLSKIFNPKKTTYATIQFTEIAGLEKSSNGQKSRTSEFLSAIRNADCLVHILRAFESDIVPHIEGSIDPMRDLETVQNELLLTDWSLVETRLERIAKTRMKSPEAAKEEPILTRCMEALEAGKPLSTVEFSEEDERLTVGYTFFTRKPMIVVVNLDEEQLQSGQYPKKQELAAWCSEHNIPLLEMSAEVELEISQLDEGDREEFMREYGLTQSGIERLARAAYHHLGLISFFTVGEDEVRAWTIRKGSTAKEAGGKIHSDIGRGFIRAEVCSYDDFVQYGSLAALKEKGLLRLEGKDYIVQDGDIMSFRFNV